MSVVADKKIQQKIAYERCCLVALGLELTDSSTLSDAQAEYERLASGEGAHKAANLPIDSVWHRAVKSRLANWAEWERDLPPKAPANDHYSNCEACRAQGLAVNTPPQVHVYGQHGNHDEAYIIGDRKGLTRLAEAIQKALEGLHGQTWAQGVAGATARDGEGYAIYVVALSEERFAGTQLPYASADGDAPPPGRPPWSLVTHDPDETVLEDKEWFQHPAVDDHRPVTFASGAGLRARAGRKVAYYRERVAKHRANAAVVFREQQDKLRERGLTDAQRFSARRTAPSFWVAHQYYLEQKLDEAEAELTCALKGEG